MYLKFFTCNNSFNPYLSAVGMNYGHCLKNERTGETETLSHLSRVLQLGSDGRINPVLKSTVNHNKVFVWVNSWGRQGEGIPSRGESLYESMKIWRHITGGEGGWIIRSVRRMWRGWREPTGKRALCNLLGKWFSKRGFLQSHRPFSQKRIVYRIPIHKTGKSGATV